MNPTLVNINLSSTETGTDPVFLTRKAMYEHGTKPRPVGRVSNRRLVLIEISQVPIEPNDAQNAKSL